MKKEQLVFGLVGIIIGIIIGTIVGSYSLPHQVAVSQIVPATPAVQQEQTRQQAASESLPKGHPPIDNSGLMAELAQQMAVLKADPQNQQALVTAANLNFDLKNYSEASLYYEKALKQDSGNVNMMTDLGTTYFYSHKPEKALELYKKSLSIDPKHAQTLMNIGVVKMMTGDKKGAAEAWEKLISYHPDIEQISEIKATVQKLRAES